MELDSTGGGGGAGMGMDEAPIVYQDDSGGAISSTSSGLAMAATRKQGPAGALGDGDSMAPSSAPAPAQASDASTAAAPATAGEETPARSPLAPTATTARRGASGKASRFEQLVSQSFEESKLRSAAPGGVKAGGGAGTSWAARVQQAGLRVARSVVKFLNSRSTSMVRF
jgi:hypothetical protein